MSQLRPLGKRKDVEDPGDLQIRYIYTQYALVRSDRFFLFINNTTLSFLSDEDEEITRKWLHAWGTENGVRTLDGKDISENREITISRSVLHSTEPKNIARILGVSVIDANKLCSFLKVVDHLLI